MAIICKVYRKTHPLCPAYLGSE